MDSEQNENLQLAVIADREKYTLAIEKVVRKTMKLKMKQIEKEIEQLREKLKEKNSLLEIPDLNIKKNLESTASDTKTDDELKSLLSYHIRSLEMLTKCLNCSVAQEVAQL